MKRYVRAGIVEAKDGDIFTRISVASDPRTSTRELWQLSRDYNPSVREGVANNPNATEEMLMQLANDSDPWTSRVATERLLEIRYGGQS
jgi:hypothetical protein